MPIKKIGKFSADVNLKYINDDAIGAPRLRILLETPNYGIRLFAPSIDVNDMLGAGGLGTTKMELSLEPVTILFLKTLGLLHGSILTILSKNV